MIVIVKLSGFNLPLLSIITKSLFLTGMNSELITILKCSCSGEHYDCWPEISVGSCCCRTAVENVIKSCPWVSFVYVTVWMTYFSRLFSLQSTLNSSSKCSMAPQGMFGGEIWPPICVKASLILVYPELNASLLQFGYRSTLLKGSDSAETFFPDLTEPIPHTLTFAVFSSSIIASVTVRYNKQMTKFIWSQPVHKTLFLSKQLSHL